MAVKDVTKAVIPAAGLGTRFLPATKATPKEMLPVVDKPAIQYVVEEAVAAGLLNGFEEPFHNLWRYYLMYCEGGFRGGAIDVAQITMVKA